jgi:hypothetical protein
MRAFLRNTRTGEVRSYASQGHAAFAARKLGNKWEAARSYESAATAPVEAAPANPERVAEAVEFVTEADLQLPDIYNMPFERLPRHEFDYKLLNCVALLAAVYDTAKAREWAMANAKAAAHYDHAQEDAGQ